VSDTIDDFNAIKAHQKSLRAKYGVPCPECQRLLPKAHPKILLPGGYCRMHKYTDPRPELTDAEWQNVNETKETI
jgi:hypothetical protein